MKFSRFVADVGGTNIRLATEVNGQVSNIKKYLCKDFTHIADAIEDYFSQFPDAEFEAGCIAIACPVNHDLIKMTNHSWQFSVKETRERLNLKSLLVINDFTAVAMCVPVLNDEQKLKVGGGNAQENENIAVFGPGTGLGVGHLVKSESGWQTLDGEGGHVDFAPADEVDITVWQYLRSEGIHPSAEEVLSGRGLVNIYRALAKDAGVNASEEEASGITGKALNGSCDICLAALGQFCRILGSFAGNLALNLGTFGGVYIAGGVVQHFVDHFATSDFRLAFEAKGRFTDYVRDIPTYLITEPDFGLIGAAAHLEQHYKG
jgi:glucokinase